MSMKNRMYMMRQTTFSVLVLLLISIGMLLAIDKMWGVDNLRKLTAESGPFGPLIYIVLKASTFVIAPLSGTALKISAGAVFGIWRGTLYTLIGDVVGGSINFWLARSFGRGIVSKLVGTKGMERIDGFVVSIGGWRALLFSRVFFSAVYDFISYAAGLTLVSYRSYIVVSIVGGVVSTAFWVALGARFAEDQRLIFIVTTAVLVLASVFLGIYAYMSRVHGKDISIDAD